MRENIPNTAYNKSMNSGKVQVSTTNGNQVWVGKEIFSPGIYLEGGTFEPEYFVGVFDMEKHPITEAQYNEIVELFYKYDRV